MEKYHLVMGLAASVKGAFIKWEKKKKSVRFFPSVLFSRQYGHYRHLYRDLLGLWCIYGKIACVCALYGGLEVC